VDEKEHRTGLVSTKNKHCSC